MKKFISRFFEFESTKTTYKEERINLLILIIVSVLEYLLLVLILEVSVLLYRILCSIYFIKLFILLIALITRRLCISDNIEKMKLNDGVFKFKHMPCKYLISDINKWLENADIPDTIYLKSNTKKVNILEISFEVEKRTGPFINKAIFFNDKEMSVDECKEQILEKCFIEDDYVEVLMITENNNPKLFEKIIKDFK